jgi:hypothetical protein
MLGRAVDCSQARVMEPSLSSPEPMSPPAPRRWRGWAVRGAFESVLIVFSVVLALFLSQWAEDGRTAGRVREMRGFLAAEMRANRETLASDHHLPHHDRLKRAFAVAAGRQAEPVNRDGARDAMQALTSSGLHPPQLRDAVWTSVSGGELIEHMSPEEVFALAEVYKAQSELESWNGRGVEIALDLIDMIQEPETAKRRLTRMVIFLEDMTSQERRLIGLYDGAIARLEGAPARDGASPTG